MANYGFTVNCDGDAIAQMKKIEAGLQSMGVKAKMEVQQTESSFDGLGSHIKGVFGELKSIIAGSLFVGGIFGGYEFVKNSKEAYEALEKSVTKVNTVLRSTGNAAGLSSNAIQGIAKDLDGKITNSRAEIMDAASMQLSFTNIRGPMFKEGMKAVADFATFYKMDMTNAALMVDKALNDPLLGYRRLQRMGVTFTEEQAKQIKNYAQQGKLVKEQQIILGELNREFGGQAAAFALTDEGKIMMAKKSWYDLKLEIGEMVSQLEVSLVPVFQEIVGLTKEAFESAPVQFFFHHLKDLVELVVKVIPIWVTYKGVMGAAAFLTETFAIKNGILTASFGELTVMTDGSTVAMEGFEMALDTTVLGAFALGIGYIVEQFISMNEELSKTVEKMSHFKETSEKISPIMKTASSTWNAYNSDAGLSSSQKSQLLTDAMKNKKDAEDALAMNVTPSIKATQGQIASVQSELSAMQKYYNQNGNGESFLKKFGSDYFFKKDEDNKKLDRLNENLKEFKNMPNYMKGIIAQSNSIIKDYSAKGIKPITYHAAKGATGLKDNAIHTSSISGGLGEAKIINMRIDTVQKNFVNSGREWEKDSENAVDFLLRTLNNMAYPGSATQ